MQNQILRRKIAADAQGITLTHEGGEAFTVDVFTHLERFLMLGSTSTFYVGAWEATNDAITTVDAAISRDAGRVLAMVTDVHLKNRALKRDPLLYVLARLTMPNLPITYRRSAANNVSIICRTGTELLHWIAFRRGMGGSNVLFRKAIRQWFLDRTPGELALQAVKYDQRDGWTLRDALRLARPKAPNADYAAVFDWITHKDKRVPWNNRTDNEDVNRLFDGYTVLREDTVPESIRTLTISRNRMPREAVPGPMLQQREVWEALFPDMPGQALIRNLGKLSSVGVFDSRENQTLAVQKISAAAKKLHPFAFLIARKTYNNGKGDKGKLTWTPDRDVSQALDESFGEAFGTLPRNETIKPLIALDVSGSMTWGNAGNTPLMAYEAEAALALVLAYQFPNAEFVMFSHGLAPFMAEGTYDGLIQAIEGSNWSGGATYLDLPLAYARQVMKDPHVYTDGTIDQAFDAVVTITDNETHYRDVRPDRYVKIIHTEGKPDFRHAVVALAANKISVADPRDPHQMDFVGLDASMPIALSRFLVGDL